MNEEQKFWKARDAHYGKEPDSAKCPACDGSGLTNNPDDEDEQCEVCDGFGEIPL